MSPDVDFTALAQLADGYSGDDISGVCRDSAMASMRRKIAGKTPAEIRWQNAASLLFPTLELPNHVCKLTGLCYTLYAHRRFFAWTEGTECMIAGS